MSTAPTIIPIPKRGTPWWAWTPQDRRAVAGQQWAADCREAFLDGYAEAGAEDPRKHAVLLRALTLDKAVYEVLYEARHRPSWLSIPLDSIADA